jgi:hypothetical protein
MPASHSYAEAVARAKLLKKRQRRFQIELLIAVGVICLILGFVMGAGWHYAKTRVDDHTVIVDPE